MARTNLTDTNMDKIIDNLVGWIDTDNGVPVHPYYTVVILKSQQLLDGSDIPCVPLISTLQVQLCETRRELQELKASLRVAQKEKEQLLAEKQVRGLVWSLYGLTSAL